MPSFSIPVYIAAGGKSLRFGRDKARALLYGMPLIQHVAHTFSGISASMTVIADCRDKYIDLGLITVADRVEGLGPIGGLYTAIHHMVSSYRAEDSSVPDLMAMSWFLFVSCDMMGLQLSWVHELWKHRTLEKPMVAFGPNPWDPLFALVHPSVLPVVERCITQQQRAMWSLMEEVAVPVPHPLGWNEVSSINTQEALESWVSRHPSSGV